ncbi:MAG: phosphatase PAP2 family protein [Gemmatimonadaceae bacterium]
MLTPAANPGALDTAIRSWMLAHRSPAASSLFALLSRVFSVTPFVIAAVVGGILLAWQRRWLAGSLVAMSGVLAVVSYLLVKSLVRRPRPTITADLKEGTFSFPSAHSTASSAICVTAAWILWRERLIGRGAALALAVIVPVLVGVSRLYLDVHWASDVLGGWTIGVLLAAMAALVHRSVVRRTALALLLVAAPLQARAQDGVVLGHRDLFLIAGATLGSGALSIVDSRVARAFSDSGFHARHPDFTTAAKRGSIATETLLMITGGSVYAIAQMSHDDGTADVALHTTEAIATTAMFIQVVRGVLGRGRPYVVDDDNGEVRNGDPREFKLFRGFTSYNYRSYPSMHAMASFAAASALASEMRRRDTPHRAVIAPALYAAAAIPSLSRMYLDEHWASDIAMGVFLGVFAGQKVVNYSHDHPDNRVDHELLRPSARATIQLDARGWSLAVTPF